MCALKGLQACLTIGARGCRQRLAREPRRVAWYPGSTQKAAAFRSSLPGIEELGAAAPADAGAPPQAYLPWLFKAGLSPEEVCDSLSGLRCRHMAGACMCARPTNQLMFKVLQEFYQVGAMAVS